MKKICLCLLFCAGIIVAATAARADVNIFIGDLNRFARVSPMDYNTQLSVQFGVPAPQVSRVRKSVMSPADAFMCFQLAQILGVPPTKVLYVYQGHRNQGWGAIARRMGVKRGSPEYQAFTNGGYSFVGFPDGKHYEGHGGQVPEPPGYDDRNSDRNHEHGKGHR